MAKGLESEDEFSDPQIEVDDADRALGTRPRLDAEEDSDNPGGYSDSDEHGMESSEEEVGRPLGRKRRRIGALNFIDNEAEVDEDEDEDELINDTEIVDDVHPDDDLEPAGADLDDRHHRELDM